MHYQPKILCVTRIGNKQACASWIFDTALLSKMTLIVSSFQDLNFNIPDHPSIIRHEFKGGKWQGIFNFFQENPAYLNDYDYFFFPDDDIETTSSNILAFFEQCQEHNLKLAQPALKADSYFSHIITIERSAFSVRRTNFVELMIPYMSRNVLLQCLPFFKDTNYGWGLDFIWASFTDTPTQQVGIIDTTPVGHYRPLAGNNNQSIQTIQAQEMMYQERQVFMDEYTLHKFIPSAFSALLRSGKPIDSLLQLRFWDIVSLYKLPNSCFKKRKSALRAFKLSMKTTIKKINMPDIKLNN